jgi:pyridoxamine 5'-phosphate oxidase
MSLADMRKRYTAGALSESDLISDPLELFRSWLEAAITANVPEPTAMTLATADERGRPSARMVLLKGASTRGFVFYSNYGSRKGQELAENPHAALVFYWSALERQVRAEGKIARLSREESAEYFHSRPAGSQLGAWASPQSRVLSGREELEERLEAIKQRFGGADIPLPDFWGGYLLEPTAIEFWQGREDRLHDRFRYERDGPAWRHHRLAP